MEACPCDTHERQRDEEDDRHKDGSYQFRHVNSHLVIARLSGDRSYHPTTALQEFSTWVPPHGGVCTHNLPNLDLMHSFRSQPQSTASVDYGIPNAQRHQPHLSIHFMKNFCPLPAAAWLFGNGVVSLVAWAGRHTSDLSYIPHPSMRAKQCGLARLLAQYR